MSYEYIDGLDAESKVRYRAKLDLIGLSECPYRLAASVWKGDPTKWPDVEYPDIYDYLVNTPGKVAESLLANYL